MTPTRGFIRAGPLRPVARLSVHTGSGTLVRARCVQWAFNSGKPGRALQRCGDSLVADSTATRRYVLPCKNDEIAPKSLPIGGAQPCHEPQRSPSTVRSVGMLWRGGFRRDSDRNFSKFFAAAKFFVRNRARSRRNPCRFVVRSLNLSRRGLQALCRASACCGT